MTLPTDKVLALAEEADIIYVGQDGSAIANCDSGSEISAEVIKFAALIQQQMIKDGLRSPDQVKELAESSGCYDWLLHSANRQEIEETLLSGEAWHKIDADIRRRSKE